MLENLQSSLVDILEVQSSDICDQMRLISPHGEYCGYTTKKCEKCGFYTNFEPFLGKTTIFHIVNTLGTRMEPLFRQSFT